MSYYRHADGSIPCPPPPDEEIITTPTLEDATLAPRRDMFEILEEVISPNASAQPLAMMRTRNKLPQRRVVNRDFNLGTRPDDAQPRAAPTKSTKLVWNAFTHCHWLAKYLTKDGKTAYKHCRFSQTFESLYCDMHSCRALTVDGNKCPNGVVDLDNPVCFGYHEENGRMELAKMCPTKKAQQIADAKVARLQEFVDSMKWAAARWPDLDKSDESHSSSSKGIEKLEEEIRQIKLASPAHRTLSLPSMSEALETAQTSPGGSRALPPWYDVDGRRLGAHAST